MTRIHCSYIGFEEQAIILQGNKKNYRIVLQPSAHALADVVVTGYQTLERRKLTAAIAKVELSDAMIGANKSIDQALTNNFRCTRSSGTYPYSGNGFFKWNPGPVMGIRRYALRRNRYS